MPTRCLAGAVFMSKVASAYLRYCSWRTCKPTRPKRREMPAADQAPRNKSVRRLLPEHLPRDEKVYAPTADACPSCGGGLRPLGEDVAEQLEFVPASFRVIRHVRPKLACSCCDAIID